MKRLGALVLVLALLIAGGALLFLARPRPYDPAFDTRMAEPAYTSHGPVVLYDEDHRNTHTAGGGYRPLADLIRNDGYELRVTQGRLSPQILKEAAVLLIVLARGANDANDQSAFDEAEVAAVDAWVRAGGSLLLVTDHWPYGAAVSSLGERLGLHMGKGMVEDPDHHDPERGESHLVFSADNGLLKDHPIVRGRNARERIQRVLSFTGQSVAGPDSAVPFLALSETATERPPTAPKVEKKGADVRVNMEYGEPLPAAGRAQGLALETGRGRVVVLGEAGMLRAERGKKGMRVGMNVPGYDNRQLALNILHWLSRVI